jgi:2'-5' RNA ligase
MAVMARFYVAVKPPEPQSRILAEVMGDLGDPWPLPHVTVLPPPGLSRDQAWLPEVRAVAERSEGFRVAFAPMGSFDDRTIYVGVESPGLVELHAQIHAALARDPESRRRYAVGRAYVPHLTIARVSPERAPATIERVAPALAGLEPFTARELTVFTREESAPAYHPWAWLALAT